MGAEIEYCTSRRSYYYVREKAFAIGFVEKEKIFGGKILKSCFFGQVDSIFDLSRAWLGNLQTHWMRRTIIKIKIMNFERILSFEEKALDDKSKISIVGGTCTNIVNIDGTRKFRHNENYEGPGSGAGKDNYWEYYNDNSTTQECDPD